MGGAEMVGVRVKMQWCAIEEECENFPDQIQELVKWRNETAMTIFP